MKKPETQFAAMVFAIAATSAVRNAFKSDVCSSKQMAMVLTTTIVRYIEACFRTPETNQDFRLDVSLVDWVVDVAVMAF